MMEKIKCLKKGLTLVFIMTSLCAVLVGSSVWGGMGNSVSAKGEGTVITLRINDPNMTVNGKTEEIDPGRGTVPVVVNDRTLVPIRAIIEAIGGTVKWNERTQEVWLIYRSDIIRLVMDSTTAYLNDEAHMLDVAPTSINDRTMLPIRFIAEGFQFHVDWQEETQTVMITLAD